MQLNLRLESICGLYCRRCFLGLCTYATTIFEDSNPLMGSLQFAVFRHDEIMHLCNYYLRFESTCGFYCSCCCFQKFGLCSVCNYYLRFESTYGLYADAVFQKCSDYARANYYPEIRIHLWALLQIAVFRRDEIMQLCNYYLRCESTCGFYCRRCFLSENRIMHLCNYYLRFEST
ncbi:hypothetical protein CEXT_54341 [Caerostris extrusa]|uniref:Uncharacterized protein n=1 Tax=Caerostris extrusa TaxID=172846 RepID=A0AAV4WN68_CAEEX|nr:hypothetical protein CEXT_54341 [Caerostris extrusa]